MMNSATQIVPTKIMCVTQALMLAEYAQKSVVRTKIEEENAAAIHAKLTSRDVIMAEWAASMDKIFDTLSKNLDRDWEMTMKKIRSVANA